MEQIESFYQNQIQASFLDDGTMTRRLNKCYKFDAKIPKEKTKIELSGKLGKG